MSNDCNCNKTNAAASSADARPDLALPGAATSGDTTMSDSIPTQVPSSSSLSASSASSSDAAPSFDPASSVQAASGGDTVWNNDKRAAALWSINQNRNSWVYVNGVGWKKLANNSDSAIVALTILASNAKQSQTTYTYRDEADGMIHESYVW